MYLSISIKIGLSTIITLLLVGRTHSVAPQELLQNKTIISQSPNPGFWHDGSKGGTYGIGEGWSIERLPPDYKTRGLKRRKILLSGQTLRVCFASVDSLQLA